jgi:hypothetical protein
MQKVIMSWKLATELTLIIAVGLERGQLSLMRINEELLVRKVAAPV